MKLEVFEYLIAIEKHGSLNRAAENLYVSQPNLTNVIRSLEEELGYPVLTRSNRGVRFTEQGRQVLQVAHNIVRESGRLKTLGAEGQPLNLNISIGNNDGLLAALCEAVNRASAGAEVSLAILNLPVMEALERVYSQQLDLAYMIVPTSLDPQIREYAARRGLQAVFFPETICQITLRRGHPLLRDSFSPEALWNYPFVDFYDQYPNAYGAFQQYINPRKRIMVDHYSLRAKLVASTDAYAIGMYRPTAGLADSELVYIPTPGLFMHLVEVRRLSDRGNALYDALRASIERETNP